MWITFIFKLIYMFITILLCLIIDDKILIKEDIVGGLNG